MCSRCSKGNLRCHREYVQLLDAGPVEGDELHQVAIPGVHGLPGKEPHSPDGGAASGAGRRLGNPTSHNASPARKGHRRGGVELEVASSYVLFVNFHF